MYTPIGFFASQANQVIDGLTAYFDAGDVASYPGTGTTWTDLSPTARNITWNSTPASIHTAGATGFFALNTSNRLRASLTESIPNTTWYNKDNNEITLELLFRPIAFTNYQYFFAGFGNINSYLSDTTGYSPVGGSSLYVQFNNSGATAATGMYTGTLTANIFHHVIFSRNGNGGYVQVNGVRNTSWTSLTTWNINQGNTTFATGDTGAEFINSDYSVFRLYNRDLTENEGTQQYNYYKNVRGYSI
jgi:hypothetical protein